MHLIAMINDFNVTDLLQSAIGYKGLPFPGAWFTNKGNPKGAYSGRDFELDQVSREQKLYTNKGVALYKKDMLGRYYFMPVCFAHDGEEYEIDCAVVSISRSKTIIETPMVGRRGSIKELISIDDYAINIKGLAIGENQEWPEEKLDRFNELFNINEAIELRCALTSVFLHPSDKLVIKKDSIAMKPGVEHIQIIELDCVTDREFELIIE